MVVESCATLQWVTLLIFCWLSFEWLDFGLKYLVTVMPKSQPTEFKASILNFPISETFSKCSSLFRHADSNWVIIMELKRKVEYSWLVIESVRVSRGIEVYFQLGMEWDSISFQLQLLWRALPFFFKKNLQYGLIWFVVGA